MMFVSHSIRTKLKNSNKNVSAIPFKITTAASLTIDSNSLSLSYLFPAFSYFTPIEKFIVFPEEMSFVF